MGSFGSVTDCANFAADYINSVADNLDSCCSALLGKICPLTD